MKALVCRDGQLFFEERVTPLIKSSKDAIVKVAYSSICTSDLHILKGCVPRANDGIVLGHEFVGEVVDVGADVVNLKVGDRVAANCITFCGECYFCKRGYINNCENGGWELGCRIDGGQAELVRIPFADCSLTKIPKEVSYRQALFVGDILSSGYFGAELCELKGDDSIAVIGSGPVGLCAMMSARLFTSGKIFAIDIDDERLKIAKENELANICINPLKEDVNEVIKQHTYNRGVDKVVEAAGVKETFEMAWRIARPNAIVAVVAMYEESLTLPLPEMYGKNLIFKTGGVDAVHCEKLLHYLSANKISTDCLISREFEFADITKAYQYFEARTENCLKVVIRH